MSIFAIVIIVEQRGSRWDGLSDAPFAATNQLRWVATTTGVRSNDISLSCAQSVYSISLPYLPS